MSDDPTDGQAEADDWCEPEDADDYDAFWICDCGHFEESDFCCSLCGREPPWGCDCDAHEAACDEDDDESWMEDVP